MVEGIGTKGSRRVHARPRERPGEKGQYPDRCSDPCGDGQSGRRSLHNPKDAGHQSGGDGHFNPEAFSKGNRRFKSSWRSSCHHPGTEEAAKELSAEVHGEKVGIKLTISPKGKAHGGVDVGSTPRSKDKNGEHDDRTKRKRNDAVACPHRNATATHADHQRRAEKFPSRLSPHKLARANGLKAFVKKVMNRSYPRQASRSGCFSFGHG